MAKENKKIVVTGGGTGGHVFPALAIATEFKNRGFSVLYVGNERGFEAKLVPVRGFPIAYVKSGAVKNQGVGKILKTMGGLTSGVISSLKLLREYNPAAVIGVGGYVSVPVCFAAFLLRIPIFLQEQNVSVGIANRVLGRFAKKVFLGFPQAAESFSKNKIINTGNPVRGEFFTDQIKPYNPSANRILIMGGSQGAHAVNEAIIALLPKLQEKFPGLSIQHQTGQTDHPKALAAYEKSFKGKFEVTPFIEDMVSAYSQASLVICRSGALTVSELIQVGRPAIFVPIPRIGQNDQTANADFIEKEGAGKTIEQGDGFHERLWAAIEEVYSPERLSQMAKNYSRLRWASATATIADEVEAAVE